VDEQAEFSEFVDVLMLRRDTPREVEGCTLTEGDGFRLRSRTRLGATLATFFLEGEPSHAEVSMAILKGPLGTRDTREYSRGRSARGGEERSVGVEFDVVVGVARLAVWEAVDWLREARDPTDQVARRLVAEISDATKK
jgi:hypothetical protein